MNIKNTFDGRHWETGSIQNALSLQGITAPHTGEPYSEALLLGVSGGIAFGYFTFEYKGYLPHLALLTRNTFDPLQTILERLGIAQDVRQTNKVEIAEKNLREALDSGLYPLVWADQFILPYNNLGKSETMWAMFPILAVSIEGENVLIADRSSQPFRLSMEELTQARGRVKDYRYRLITLDAPQPAKLAAAVSKGIYQCIQLFTEKPPKGARHNFGFAAYQRLADMLVNTRNKGSWERFFLPGARMYHALAGSVGQPGAYSWIQIWGSAPGAERGLYADFLDEAADILKKPGLMDAGQQFRESYALLYEFAGAMLPDDVPLLGESKELIQREHDLFVEQGQLALEEIKIIHARRKELLKNAENDFPLSQAEAADFRAHLRDLVLKISEVEQKAVESLQRAVV
ncbi:MAG: BtrH N-terminal domain-containing protein [Anaerolineales bacterium]|jgi:hypothetical protein